MFIESGAGAKCVIVPPSIADFQIDFGALEQRLNEHTKAVVVNSPNNPSGAVYSEQTIKRLADMLRGKEKEYGHPIYRRQPPTARRCTLRSAVPAAHSVMFVRRVCSSA